MTIINFFGNLSTLAKRGLTVALLGSTAALLASCGGGGATPSVTLTGPLGMLPDSGSLYANVPVTFTVSGGKPPYQVVSNEQTVMPLNLQPLVGNTFTIAPNQPGVFDPSTDPLAVPARTMIISIRDSLGEQKANTYKVLQSYLTGYSLSISTFTTCAVAAAGGTGPVACAGAESLLELQPSSNGLYYANKVMRFTALYGGFAFITDSTGITGPTVQVTADSIGHLSARIRATPNTPTQYASFRLTDVGTGNYRDFVFVIVNANGSNTALSVLPSAIALQGPTTAVCGNGQSNIVVFGGQPPYTATSTSNSIVVSPQILTRSGDSFSVQIFPPASTNCLTGQKVIITDGAGAVTSVDVTTTVGTTPPLLPLSVSPNAICMRDGDTAVINITGGNNTKVINSTNTFLVTASPITGTGNFTTTLTSSNNGDPDGPGPLTSTAVQVNVSDGANTATVNVTRKALCP